MNQNEAKQNIINGLVCDVELRRNPKDMDEWIIYFLTSGMNRTLLTDASGEPIASSDLNRLKAILSNIEINTFRVTL